MEGGWIKRRRQKAHFCTACSYNAPPFPSVTHARARRSACSSCVCACVRVFAAVRVNDMCQCDTAARLCREQGLRAIVPPYGGIISIRP